MRKKVLLILLLLILVTGCKNKEETDKSDYLAMKSNLLGQSKFIKSNDLPCDITVKLDRINEEKITYKVILDNPKENMHSVKVIVVHNFYTEEMFPSIGFFDKKKALLISSDDNHTSKLTLKGNIETTSSIENLDLELKVLIEYQNDSDENKAIYYKTT